MASQLRYAQLQAPNRGMFLGVGPHAIPKNGALNMTNFLPGRQNPILPVRGPSVKGIDWTGLDGTNTANYWGVVYFNGGWLFSNHDRLSVIPEPSPIGTVFHLNIGLNDTDLQTWDGDVGSAPSHLTLAGFAIDNIPGRRYARSGDYCYIKSISSDNSGTINGETVPLFSLTKWDGSGTAPVIMANAPAGFSDVATYANRLFVAGGTPADDPIAGAIEANTLHFTDVQASGGTAFTDAVATWQDDVSGDLNRIVVESDDADDCLVALAPTQNGMLLFKRRSTHILVGSGPSNFAVRTLSKQYGCISQTSIVQMAGGVCFLSDSGYIFFDGSQFSSLSDNVNAELIPVANSLCGVDDGHCADFVSCARLPNDYIFMQITTSVFTGNNAYLLHFPTKSWTRFEPAGGTQYDYVAQGGTYSLAMGSSDTYLLSRVTSPEAATQSIAGATSAKLCGDFDGTAGGGTASAFTAKAIYAPADLSGPAAASQVHRVISRYKANTQGLHPAAGEDVFTYNLFTSRDRGVVTATWNAGAESGAGWYWLPHRHVEQLGGIEIGDCQIEVTYTATDTDWDFSMFPPWDGESAAGGLYVEDVTIEYQPARPLPDGW